MELALEVAPDVHAEEVENLVVIAFGGLVAFRLCSRAAQQAGQ